jgi:LacI family transcriptional regulator
MKDVAEEAGVAMSTVSRVLSGHPDVSPGMRKRVTAAVDRLQYRPNLLAQGLRSQQTRTIGFLVGDISNPLLAEMVKGAVTCFRQNGYAMILTDSERDPELDAMHLDLFEQRRVDGLILSPSREDHVETLGALARMHVPAVLIDRQLPSSFAIDRVLSDHQVGMKEALEHLIRLGHRRIDLIVGLPVRATVERKAALVAAFAEQGLEPTYRIYESDVLSVDSGREGARSLLDDSDPPTALLVGGNQLLAGALMAIRSRGLRIPDDLSLVSTDETVVTALHDPPIATVRRDTVGLGQAAANLLLERIRERTLDQDAIAPAAPTTAREITLPTEFAAHESCAPPRTGSLP